ncbi:hypothetical protein [Treponema sp. R80B11-R83G3]
MKIMRKFFLGLVALVMAFSACGSDNTDNGGDPKLAGTITLSLTQLPQHGLDGVVRYGDTLTAVLNSRLVRQPIIYTCFQN